MRSGALCGSRRELSDAYFVANFGFDAADNERVGGGGTGTKPGPKSGKDQAARPLAGAEVLVAVRAIKKTKKRGKCIRLL